MARANDAMTPSLSVEQVAEAVKACPFVPVLTKIVVYVPSPEEVTQSGIIIPAGDANAQEHRSYQQGYLIAMGPEAFYEFTLSLPLFKIGQRVAFPRYQGDMPDNEAKYRILQDREITAIVKEAHDE